MLSINYAICLPSPANAILLGKGCGREKLEGIGELGSGVNLAIEYSSGLNLSELQFLYCQMEIISLLSVLNCLVTG